VLNHSGYEVIFCFWLVDDHSLQGAQQSQKGELEKYITDDNNVMPTDRIHYFIGLCMAYIDDVMSSEPYTNKSHSRIKSKFKPMVKLLSRVGV